jgi:hypothetical protein
VSPIYAVVVTSLAAFLILFLFWREPGIWYSVAADVVATSSPESNEETLRRQRYARRLVERLKDPQFVSRAMTAAGMATGSDDARSRRLNAEITRQLTVREKSFGDSHRLTLGIRSQNVTAALALTNCLAQQLVHDATLEQAQLPPQQWALLRSEVATARENLVRSHHELEQFAASLVNCAAEPAAATRVATLDDSAEILLDSATADATQAGPAVATHEAEIAGDEDWDSLDLQPTTTSTTEFEVDDTSLSTDNTSGTRAVFVSAADRQRFRTLQAAHRAAEKNLTSAMKELEAAERGRDAAHETAVAVAQPATIVATRGGSIASRQLTGLGLMAYLMGMSVLFLHGSPGRDEVFETADQIAHASPVPLIAAVGDHLPSAANRIRAEQTQRRLALGIVRIAEAAIAIVFAVMLFHVLREQAFGERLSQDPLAAYGEALSRVGAGLLVRS